MNIPLRSKTALLSLIYLLLILLLLFGCGGGVTGTITEAGSTTVQPLAESLAEAFRKNNPDITIIIQGGGSSVGIKSANDGTVDIGASSRELKPDEPGLIKHLIARDVIAIIVHPANKINGLTKNQVRDIFSGKITNWSQVGGENKEIHVVAREEGSGTRSAFEEMVMGKDSLITKYAILQAFNGAIKTTVARDPNMIGFLSYGYADKSVKCLLIEGVDCNTENAVNGTYPVIRPLYFLTKQQPTGIVREFIDFCFSAEGQQIVLQEGYIPVK